MTENLAHNTPSAIDWLAEGDPEFSQPRTEFVSRWGKSPGGSQKPAVDRHLPVGMRAPMPDAEGARQYL